MISLEVSNVMIISKSFYLIRKFDLIRKLFKSWPQTELPSYTTGHILDSLFTSDP